MSLTARGMRRTVHTGPRRTSDGSRVGYSLGVDVGTTYTAVGISRSGRAEIAPLGARGWSVPSVVYLGADQTVLVGEPAVRRSASDPLRVVREFKRRIGDPVPLMVGGAPVSADTLTGMVLRAVVQQVVALETGPPDHAVVTHPANWGPYKIDCLWQAIRMATLDQLCPVSLMSEPEAAAAYYASAERLEPGDVIAVYDLGGGTFDAAVLRRTDTGWEFLAPAEGIERLGGIDFDEAVLAHVDAATDGQVCAPWTPDRTPTAMAALLQLRRDCVDAKEALSSDIDATIRVALPTYHADVRLTRAEFEAHGRTLRPGQRRRPAPRPALRRHHPRPTPRRPARRRLLAASPWSARSSAKPCTSPSPSTPTPNTPSPSAPPSPPANAPPPAAPPAPTTPSRWHGGRASTCRPPAAAAVTAARADGRDTERCPGRGRQRRRDVPPTVAIVAAVVAVLVIGAGTVFVLTRGGGGQGGGTTTSGRSVAAAASAPPSRQRASLRTTSSIRVVDRSSSPGRPQQHSIPPGSGARAGVVHGAMDRDRGGVRAGDVLDIDGHRHDPAQQGRPHRVDRGRTG